LITRRQLLVVSAAGTLSAATSPFLLDNWRAAARATDGTVGAAALWLDSGRLVSLNGDERFPLASVCKLPMAMNIFALVEERKLELNREIEVPESDVWPGVSDIAKVWPRQRSWPLEEMTRLMVSQSDNTAEEVLYRLGGGAPAMAARFRQWKIDGVRIDRSERDCGRDRTGATAESTRQATLRYLADPRDTGTPNGTVQLLARLFRGELLSVENTRRMIEMLKAATTFPGRLKGLLPAGTVVAHKTGSIWSKDLAAATNDSGVIYLPGGRQVAISVYIKASTKSDTTRDRVIARIARAAYEAS
jgi:beta-lactamase class A